MELIDNTVFQEKQDYMYIIHYADTLIRHIRANHFENEEKILKEIADIRDIAFAGLLRCGLAFSLNEEQNTAMLMIDHISYSCSLEKLRYILGRDASAIIGNHSNEICCETAVMKEPDENPMGYSFCDTENVSGCVDRSEKSDAAIEESAGTRVEKDSVIQPKKAIEHSETENSAKRFLDFQNIYQKEKAIGTFVYEKLRIKAAGREEVILVAPLQVYENEPKPEIIMVSMAADITYQMPDSDGNICFSVGEVNLILRAYFVSGRFKVSIMEEYGNRQLFSVKLIERQWCHDSRVGFGHVCFESGAAEIHVLPLSTENDDTGKAKCIAVVKEEGRIEIYLLVSKTNSIIKILGTEREVLCYWQDKVLLSEVIE